jgi:hypothetical protein
MTYQDSPSSKKVASIQRYQWLSTHCLPESHCTPPILWKMSHSHLPWKPGSSTAPLCSHHIRQLAAHHNTQHTKKIIWCKSFSTGLDSVSLSLSLSFLGFFFCLFFLSDEEHENSCAQSRSRDGDQGGGRRKQTLELTLPGVKGGM